MTYQEYAKNLTTEQLRTEYADLYNGIYHDQVSFSWKDCLLLDHLEAEGKRRNIKLLKRIKK